MRPPVALEAPPSKSMTQRALFMAALGARPTRVVRPLACDDARYLGYVIAALGGRVDVGAGEALVAPIALGDDASVRLFCGNAGTTLRFAACLSLLRDGEIVLDGDERMRERPIGPLCAALEALGVGARF